MACGCANKAAPAGMVAKYAVTFPDGTSETYDSPMTARIEAGKRGGKVSPKPSYEKAQVTGPAA